MSSNDGCSLLPILLIVLLFKVVLVIGAYALALFLSFCTAFFMPLIIIASYFDDDISVGGIACMWIALATEFAENLFKD